MAGTWNTVPQNRPARKTVFAARLTGSIAYSPIVNPLLDESHGGGGHAGEGRRLNMGAQKISTTMDLTSIALPLLITYPHQVRPPHIPVAGSNDLGSGLFSFRDLTGSDALRMIW